jgi:1-deoxy-D-xylulose-5-phosphate reductoisomerase
LVGEWVIFSMTSASTFSDSNSNHASPVNVTILGATGSIGLNTVDVISRHPDRFSTYALVADSNVEKMLSICQQLTPQFAVMNQPHAAEELSKQIQHAGLPTKVLSGAEHVSQVASADAVDVVMAAIVGAAGLPPILAAVKKGKRILLANKEALVMSGGLFMDEVSRSGSVLLPIDSEHNAIFQCLPDSYQSGQPMKQVRRILLTASGGPFRQTPLTDLQKVTPAQACAHPNWDMGRKISVDSATMMNKGLELIEACWLFNTTPDFVDVHIHPESIIHSMVEYVDGSVLAQMGSPDMRTPIAYGLAWPDRLDSGVPSLDLFKIGRLHFESPDHNRFPAIQLAARAFNAGGTTPAVLNAANEVAVSAFLDEQIEFLAIPKIVKYCMDTLPAQSAQQLENIFQADADARSCATSYIENGLGC